ncbi:FecR family protein [bacterium A37T11]|nr:FecR family protein [bacterium A37T11]
MNIQEAEILWKKYQAGEATAQEKALLETWYLQYSKGQAPYPLQDPEAFKQAMWKAIHTQKKPTGIVHFPKLAFTAAAILLIALATALYFYPGISVNHKSTLITEIAPGGNQATLTLADGTMVELDSAQSGIIVNDKDIKYSDGKLVQNVILPAPSAVSGSEETSLPTSLTLSTPKGGQYQIILSDGTKVWLNAGSKLMYPSKFTGNQREVVVEGEAYFEVNNETAGDRVSVAGARVSRVPFVVKTRNQQILVLGTSFNVTAFANEKETKTTLVEGKVQVRSENLKLKTYNLQLLAPNQQAVVKGDNLTVSKVDVDSELAWRNNRFSFENKTFTQIMNEMGRWYNFEVKYEGPIPTDRFMGDAYRTDKLSTVLRFLKSSELDYRIEAKDNGDHTLVIINKRGGKS